MLGWGFPTIDPGGLNVHRLPNAQGCFWFAATGSNNTLWGIGKSGAPSGLPVLAVGQTVTMRYHPANGTIHASINGGAETLLYSGITQRDLVPVVCFRDASDQVSLVD